jgi:hypothetical protein
MSGTGIEYMFLAQLLIYTIIIIGVLKQIKRDEKGKA